MVLGFTDQVIRQATNRNVRFANRCLRPGHDKGGDIAYLEVDGDVPRESAPPPMQVIQHTNRVVPGGMGRRKQ